MSQRTVALWESALDNTLLNSNGFNFCIAKSVIDKTGNLTFNMVWQSKAPRPRATISWNVQYGLNWTTGVPAGNAQVTVGGAWQACNPGDSYDLNKDGLWVKSDPATSKPKPNYLNIGKNYCQYPGVTGINIIVGVLNSAGDDYDPTQLGLGMSAWYQPQEKARWWYETGAVSSSMISGAISNACEYDLTNPDPMTRQYYVSTTFVYDTGLWSTATTKPPAIQSLTSLVAPSNTDYTEQLRQEIQALAATIRDLVQAKDTSQAALTVPTPLIFKGTVNWPVTVGIGIVTAGLTAIVNMLTSKHYVVRSTYIANGDQRTRVIEFSPSSKANASFAEGGANQGIPQSIISDWNYAVASDQQDGAVSVGIAQES